MDRKHILHGIHCHGKFGVFLNPGEKKVSYVQLETGKIIKSKV
jgi:hypothetical protein